MFIWFSRYIFSSTMVYLGLYFLVNYGVSRDIFSRQLWCISGYIFSSTMVYLGIYFLVNYGVSRWIYFLVNYGVSRDIFSRQLWCISMNIYHICLFLTWIMQYQISNKNITVSNDIQYIQGYPQMMRLQRWLSLFPYIHDSLQLKTCFFFWQSIK